MTEEKVTIQLDKDVAEKLHELKKFGESYSDVVRKLLSKK